MTTTDATLPVHTYRVDHPRLSHAIYIDSAVARRHSALRAHASMAVLRQCDEHLPMDEFTVEEVQPGAQNWD